MQAVYNIAEICARHGLTDVVISPGSRSAPLTLAFARHPAFRGKIKVVPDERSAAFIGLGLAQATRRPVVLVCTSGSAGLNYAPAVAEAFFQQVPLLVFTADRPPEWIDQLDGQTIRQQNLYGRHAKGSFDFPVDTAHSDAKWHADRLVNEAINLAGAEPAGPVQVNVPLREPFYPKAGEQTDYEQDVKIIRAARPELANDTFSKIPWSEEVPERLRERVLVVVGQHAKDEYLARALANFAALTGAPVVADVTGNAGEAAGAYVHRQDLFLTAAPAELLEELKPELLITTGNSLISKSLKQYLRKHPARHHWHVQEHGAPVADVFRSLTQVYQIDAGAFFRDLADEFAVAGETPAAAFGRRWRAADQRATELLAEFFARPAAFNEFSAFRAALAALPGGAALHLANSMAVRYANILGLPPGRQLEVFANRGTSGIDGCTSTALGFALAQPERPVVLLTGDVAFFYDRNAFWHNHPAPNLRVVLFNNHGGGIFRLIDGPRQQPELDEFFETRQPLTAENLCRDFNLGYVPVSTFADLDRVLTSFFAPETGAAVLEIFTDSRTNAAVFEQYRAAVRAAFAS